MVEKRVLVCTVGGSHQPIIRTIQEHQPDFVYFICSQDDPATGNKGSYTQITGKGNVIQSSRQSEAPDLPNIPAQCALAADHFDVVCVIPDDFDQVYESITKLLSSINRKEHQIIADYTGGTKTMSAALVTAALDAGDVDLALVTGARSNLIQVQAGEYSVPASVGRARFFRAIKQALDGWQRFSYAETYAVCKKISVPSDSELRGQWQRVVGLSEAFMAWDRFDHAGAWQILEKYRSLLCRNEELRNIIETCKLLASERSIRKDALLIYDLWRNAERRASRHRYDDAIARWYRMMEWIAQFLLRHRAEIATDNIPLAKVPGDMMLTPNRDGKIQAGLFHAWELASRLADENDIRPFWNTHRNQLQEMLQIRNSAILAHGFFPLTQDQWQRVYQWTSDHLIPQMLRITPKMARISKLPPQLPKKLPGDL